MKKLATLASVALLAAAGQSSAATYDISGSFDVIALGFAIPFTVESGTYDDISGEGNWNVTADLEAAFQAGTINFNNTFTLDAATGNGVLAAPTDCTGNISACGPLGGAFQGAFTSTPVPFAEGVNTWQLPTNFGVMTFQPEFSEVPVPAAAWLFGSALVGLAGVSRKRKAA